MHHYHNITPEPFLTVKAACKFLRQPEFKLRRAIKRGLIPAYTFGNRRVLVRISEIIEAIERTNAEGGR